MWRKQTGFLYVNFSRQVKVNYFGLHILPGLFSRADYVASTSNFESSLVLNAPAAFFVSPSKARLLRSASLSVNLSPKLEMFLSHRTMRRMWVVTGEAGACEPGMAKQDSLGGGVQAAQHRLPQVRGDAEHDSQPGRVVPA